MRPIAVLAFVIAPAILRAQSTLLELQPGVRVRVSAMPMLGSRYDATVGARKGDTLSLVRAGSPSLDVPISAITVAELYRGKDRVAGMWSGVKWGTGIGLVLGGLVALSDNSEFNCYTEFCDPNVSFSDAERVLFTTAAGALYGAGIGALIGKHRWERLQVPNQRVGLHIDRRSTGVRLGMRFSFR